MDAITDATVKGGGLLMDVKDLEIQQLRAKIAELEAKKCRWYDTCPMAEAEEEHECVN